MKIISIIPARGGSKSIPKKNLVNFLGVPLISKTINQSLVSKKINRTIVSTDDEEVKREVVREMAVKHLADSLEIILEELMLDREASYIEETSFDEGLKDILDDY